MEPKNNNQEKSNNFPPVISVLGHVDHGKTTLLDKIRESSVAAREKGGITQGIGASEIEIKHEGKSRKITFIDTPGHEAFANMRSQGVTAADIVLLIIAADDGIKPQTQESITKILEAKIPFIVVFTKIDTEGAQIEKVKQQVMSAGILLEGLGGEVPYIGVSAKTGEKVADLLELIVLVYDLSGIKKDEKAEFMGVIMDAAQDKRRGIVASVIIKQGSIAVGKDIYTHGKVAGRIRALTSASGKNVKEAFPGDAVEILGMTEILPAGSVVFDREMEPIVTGNNLPEKTAPHDIMAFLNEDNRDFVPVIIKTQTTGEMEAIRGMLPEKVQIIYAGQGEVTVSDILMAKDFHALVLGFNVNPAKDAVQLAESDKVFFKSYGIIYQLLDELESLISAIDEEEGEHEIGRGDILASFLGSSGVIMGTKVTFGRLAVGDRIAIVRGEKELGRAEIVSIKKNKEDVKLVEKNVECGIMIRPEVDFAPQDAIIAYSKR